MFRRTGGNREKAGAKERTLMGKGIVSGYNHAYKWTLSRQRWSKMYDSIAFYCCKQREVKKGMVGNCSQQSVGAPECGLQSHESALLSFSCFLTCDVIKACV